MREIAWPAPLYLAALVLGTQVYAADAEAVARKALEVHSAAGFDLELVARSSSFEGRVEHLTYRPRYAGIELFGGHFQVHVAGGEPIGGGGPALPALPRDLVFELDAAGAARAVAEALAPEVVTVGEAKAVWFALGGVARAAWAARIEIAEDRAEQLVLDDRERGIVFRQPLSFDVEPDGLAFPAPAIAHPGKGAQAPVSLAGRRAGGAACPPAVYPSIFGANGAQAGRCWTSGEWTRGNNADVCLDLDGDNLCDGRAAGVGGRFLYPFTNSFADANNAAPDAPAALTNAFYWINTAHDWLYELGFDEAAGNLQDDNFGRGGFGGDAVRVDVHDGASRNRANITIAPDGIAPRMQLGLWTGLRRDSAFDADVILHEYVHALTVRLVGGPLDVSALYIGHSGAMGEGWSDALAMSFTGDPLFAEYISRNPNTGIRTVRFDQSPLTFGYFGSRRQVVLPQTNILSGLPDVHHDGEIWATVLWDVRVALGREAFERAIVAALKLTPRRPSMLQARDAILQAVQLMGGSPGAHCAVWNAFARRGFGASAALNPMEPGQPADMALSVFEAFDPPVSCGGSAPATGSAIHFEGAESESAWTATGLWHRSTRRAAAGARSWWFGRPETGDYNTGARAAGMLVSPPIALSGVSGAVLEWDQRLRGEGFGSRYDLGGDYAPFLNLDSGRVWISNDGGASWRVLSHIAHNTAGDGFVRYRVNLSRWAGQTIRLRFEFDTFTAANNANEGWFVDDIAVRALTSPPRPKVAPASLIFAAVAGAPPPPAQAFAVTNSGDGTLQWTAVSNAPWLAATPASGTGPAMVAVSVNHAALAPGQYSGALSVSASGNSETVAVSLTVAPPPGPLAAWSFDEPGAGAGVVVQESAGGRHAVTAGAGSAPVFGVAGDARDFRGADHATVAASGDLTPARLTFRAWVKLAAYPSSFAVLASQFGGANYKGWYLAVRSTGELILMGAAPPSSAPWLVSAGKLELGRWHHVVATLDRSTGAGRLYLDGAPDRTMAFAAVEADPASPLVFGRASWTNNYHLRGALDEAQIDARVWAPAEAAADFQSFAPPPPGGPLGRWSFDETAGSASTTLADSSGAGHPISIVGSRHQAIAGVAGAARWFAGWPDQATIAGSVASESFSYSAWIRLETAPQGWGVVVSVHDGGWKGWFVGIAGDRRPVLNVSGPGSKPWLVSNRALELGRWHHLAATFDGPSRRGRVYLDGDLAASAVFPAWAPAWGATATLGRASWADVGRLSFALDEARLFSGERTPVQVRAEYETLAAAARPGPIAAWEFDEAQGSALLADSSGAGRHASVEGDGAVAGAGVAGGAWEFSGSANAARLLPHAAFGSAHFTWSAWVRLPALPSGWGALFANLAADSRGWFVGVNTDGRVILSVAGQPSSMPWLLSAAPLQPGRWTHVAVSFDGVNRRGAIYLDGALDRTAVFPAYTPQAETPPTFARASWAPTAYLRVAIDRARLWAAPLSGPEIAELPWE